MRKRRALFRQPEPEPVDTEKSLEVLADADRRLADARAREPEVREMVERMEAERRRNNFGPLMAEAMRSRRRE